MKDKETGLTGGIHHKEVINNLKYCIFWGLWRKQKTVVGKALKLINRLKAQYFTEELVCFYQKAKRLYEWLLLPENADLWVRSSDEPNNRGSKEYLTWRREVLKRDKVCQQCGAAENLHAHHIKPYRWFEKLQLDVNNGLALCKICHLNAH